MDADKAYKEKVGKTITQKLLDALNQGRVDETEIPLIAGYILDRMDNIETSAQVLAFINELTQKWPFFGDILTSQNDEALEEQLEKAEQADSAAINEASTLLKQNKINEALKVVESANTNIIESQNPVVQPSQAQQ